MPSFSDSIVLFILALLLFGPKRLPKLARELGKWVGEFRRASNEFKMQMEEEMRLSEQADREKQIASMEAAAPVAAPLPDSTAALPSTFVEGEAGVRPAPTAELAPATEPETIAPTYEIIDGVRTPLPIASSGALHLMPPSTGLPAPRHTAASREAPQSPLGSLVDSIPVAADPAATGASVPESAAHGD